jgi:hypothetical protein
VSVLGGCAGSRAPESAGMISGGGRVFAVPAKQLFAVAEQVVTEPPISLTYTQQSPGDILTSYREGYRGEFHIVRYWQERTRFRIVVSPDFEDPTGHSRLQISEHTQARSNDRAAWSDDRVVARPERVEELIQLVAARVGHQQPTTSPAAPMASP